MAHVSTPIVGASLNTPVGTNQPVEGDSFAEGTIVETTDNGKAIYATAAEDIAAGTALCTVTRGVGGDGYTAAASGGALTCDGGAVTGEGAWFYEIGVVTVTQAT